MHPFIDQLTAAVTWPVLIVIVTAVLWVVIVFAVAVRRCLRRR